MVKDIIFTVNTITREVRVSRACLGSVGENLQGNFIVDFDGEVVDGTGVLEMQCGTTKGIIPLTKDGDTYVAPIKSCCLTQAGKEQFQIRITMADEAVPVFKSLIFEVTVCESIGATEEVPEQYPTFVDITNARLADIIKRLEALEAGGGTTPTDQTTSVVGNAVAGQAIVGL